MGIVGIVTNEGYQVAQKISEGILYNGSESAAADGSTLEFSFVLMTIVEPNSVNVTYTINGATYTATDDGNGSISGSFLTGAIDYNTGDLKLTFSAYPDANSDVTVSYLYRQRGFFLKFGKFGVTDQKGNLDPNRNYATGRYPTWYEGNVSSPTFIGTNTMQFYLTVPANVTTSNQYIAEIYIYVEDPENPGSWKLFGIAQPSSPIEWVPFSTVRLRCQFTLTSVSPDVIVFSYTQSNEIADHDLDPNAHPHIRDALKKAGIYVDLSEDYVNFRYEGQYWDEKAQFATDVVDGDVVYRGSDGVYYKALADYTERSYPVGIADVTRGKVVVHGLIQHPDTTLPYGSMLYLSSSVAGAITTTRTPVSIGYSLGNGLILVTGRGGSGAESGLPYRTKLTLTTRFEVGDDEGCIVPDRYVVATGGELIVSGTGVFMVIDNK